jgi:hypothetical protein
MPLLGQRRPTPAPGAPTQLSGRATSLVHLLRTWWPVAWASLHLGGVVAGGALPVPAPALLAAAPESWGRVTMLTPLLACGTGPGGALLAGAATFGLAGAWGWGEATARAARVDAVAPDPWSPAVAVRQDGAALLRISGWSSPAAGGRWRAPARVLDFHVPGAAKASPCAAQPGDGVMLTGERSCAPDREPGCLSAESRSSARRRHRGRVRLPASPGGAPARVDGTCRLRRRHRADGSKRHRRRGGTSLARSPATGVDAHSLARAPAARKFAGGLGAARRPRCRQSPHEPAVRRPWAGAPVRRQRAPRRHPAGAGAGTGPRRGPGTGRRRAAGLHPAAAVRGPHGGCRAR